MKTNKELEEKTKKIGDKKAGSIDKSIYELKAYNFLVHQAEVKKWVEAMIQEKLPPGTANFCDNIRDGVYLCKLAKVFSTGIVLKINQPKLGSVLEFMAIDNISTFFKACQSCSFPKYYLFEVTDLWEKKNIYKVIHWF
jgi:Ras GTPase-activating-like protein IQGAP2/3